MDKYGVSKWIKYGTSFIVELKNGWVVEIDRNGGRVLHIYDDKSKAEREDMSGFEGTWNELESLCDCGKCVKQMDMLDGLYQLDLLVTIITKIIFILCMFVWIITRRRRK